MTDDPKKKLRDAREQIDIRLGGLFSELGATLSDMLDRIDTDGSAEIRREHEFETRNGPVRAQTGIRIRTLGDAPRGGASRDPAKPVNTRSASSQDSPETAAKSEISTRPISADILSDGEFWVLTADLPGITEKDLSLSKTDGVLVIEATGRSRRYRDSVALPEGVDVSDISVSLQNGILELRAAQSGEVDT